MKSLELSGSKRVNLGKKATKAIRNEGKVPCVIYGSKENIHFVTDVFALKKFIYTPNVFIAKINVDGETTEAIIQDMQFHPVTDVVMHVDFIQLIEGKPLITYLPINLVGTSKGVLTGGKLNLLKRKVKVKGLPSALVDNITVDITKLRVGDSIRVKELAQEGLSFLEAGNDVVVAVKTSRKIAVAGGAEEEEAEGEEAATVAEETPVVEA